MKVLYAASPGYDSYLQLSRFLQHSRNCPYEVRVAGYRDGLLNCTADYTLDSLLGFYGRLKDKSKFKTDRYLQEVQAYDPDLIISDFDYYTSYVAAELAIPLWIVSSFATFSALPFDQKNDLKIYRQYKQLFVNKQKLDNHTFQIQSADARFAYSFLGDVEGAPTLEKDFYWVRPYHVQSDVKSESRFVASLSHTDKQFINYFQNLNPKIYAETDYEGYLPFDRQYDVDVVNSYMTFSRGETSFIADAFYNNKYTLVYPNYYSRKSIINSRLIERYGIGENLYTRKNYEQFNALAGKDLTIRRALNPDTKYLHQYIMDFL